MSIRSWISGATVANDIRLRRQVNPDTAMLVVEGPNDKKLYSKFIVGTCTLIVGYGKENVVGAIDLLDAEQRVGILGIVDLDYDKILGKSIKSKNIICTECHDIEIIMFHSAALDAMVAEKASAEKLSQFLTHESDLRTALLRRVSPLGCLRLISERDQMGLDFDGLKFKFLDENLHIKINELVVYIVSRTKGCSVTVDDLHRNLLKELEVGHDLWILCQGHDCMAVLGVAFRRLIGSISAAEGDRDNIESLLRVGYGFEAFRNSVLYEKIIQWQVANAPFVIIQQ